MGEWVCVLLFALKRNYTHLKRFLEEHGFADPRL